MAPSPHKFKRILNEIPQAVDESIMGLVMCNRGLVYIENERIILRRDHRSIQGKVKVMGVIGGGHEPGSAGFVGPGMLTAGVVGDFFHCPSLNVILKAIQELGLDYPEGVLMITINYVEDRLSCGLAVEKALGDDINVKLLVVTDDCSLLKPPEPIGRRGLAGIVLAFKIAGAMAEAGRNLHEIHATCQRCVHEMNTIAIGLRMPSILGSPAAHRVPDEDVEFGVGIGIEPGTHMVPLASAASMCCLMLDVLFANSFSLDESSEVVLLVNNYGGTSWLEVFTFVKEVLTQLALRRVVVRRVYSGTFVTSLDMCGISLTLLNMPSPEETLPLLDAPTDVPGWPLMAALDAGSPISMPARKFPHLDKRMSLNLGPRMSLCAAHRLHRIIRFAAEAVRSVSATLDTQDAESGDADCGSNIKNGVDGIISALDSKEIDTSRPYTALEALCSVSERLMSGTSGALYSIFFAATAGKFGAMSETAAIDAGAWIDALAEGIDAIKRHGLAKKGDRTMLEPLIAAEHAGRKSWSDGESDNDVGVSMAEAAEKASVATIAMVAKCGRACYAIKVPLKMPDAGAFCVSVWMRALSESFNLVYR